ncbi:hypothetical protein C1645_754178 [Glomus cerebriforme]|uniref:F-box domain-containing protein n=1 Tax=Glomus cerebriforme TaxID=658196 RepID=A0A397TF24_9GLOM|nr:hypothetical protein C1645_754178 [Glomus cerebriforme]
MYRLNVDCLVLIFNELRDKCSLYSCLLVNRKWCNLVVPILWNNYSWCNVDEDESIFFDTILSWLPSPSRQLLSDNYIILPQKVHSEPPLFNYISFCKFPENEAIKRIMEMVLDFNSYDKRKRDLLEQEIYKLFVSQCKNAKELCWTSSQPLSLFPGASTCFSRLRNLFIDLDCINSNALYEMAKICRYLNTLIIYNCPQDLPELIFLIDAQRNLKNVNIYGSTIRKGSYRELSKALARRCNTINHLHLGSVRVNPPSLSLVDQTQISIFNNETYDNIKEFQQYLSILEFPDLQSLNVTGFSYFNELAMLIQKTNGKISRISINSTNITTDRNVEILIKAIASNCPNLEVLHINLDLKDFIHIISLLLNCKNLVEIRLNNSTFVYNGYYVGNELLDILAKFSPMSLTNITISDEWGCSVSALSRFFECFRTRPLYYFHITFKGFRHYITKDHVDIVKKYIYEGVVKYSNICSYH